MPLKRCEKCNKLKPKFEFPIAKKSKKKRHKHCTACYTTYKKNFDRKRGLVKVEKRKRRKRAQKSKLRNIVHERLIGGECDHCGISDPVVLTFHHRFGNKIMGISQMVSKCVSIDDLLIEMGKCQILCCNCHRKLEAHKFNYKIVEACQMAGIRG